MQRQYDCYNCIYLISFRFYNNINVKLSFGKRTHTLHTHAYAYAHINCAKKIFEKIQNKFLNDMYSCFFFVLILFFLYWNCLKYFCSRNTQFNFTQLYNSNTTTTTTTTPINTISRQTVDADQQRPNQHSHTHSHSSTTAMSHNHHQQQQHQIYSDPPPPYDEIVLDIRLTSPNTSIVY